MADYFELVPPLKIHHNKNEISYASWHAWPSFPRPGRLDQLYKNEYRVVMKGDMLHMAL